MPDTPLPKQPNGWLKTTSFLEWRISHEQDHSKIKENLERKVTWDHWEKWEQEYKTDQYKQESQLSSIKQKLAFWGGVFAVGNVAVTFLLNKLL